MKTFRLFSLIALLLAFSASVATAQRAEEQPTPTITMEKLDLHPIIAQYQLNEGDIVHILHMQREAESQYVFAVTDGNSVLARGVRQRFDDLLQAYLEAKPVRLS